MIKIHNNNNNITIREESVGGIFVSKRGCTRRGAEHCKLSI
jgi:hypothetical protein